MSPELAKQHERHKAFHAAIEQKAAARMAPAVKALAVESFPAEPDPPRPASIPNAAIAAAAEIAFPNWVHEVTQIQRAICNEFGITRTDLLSHRRTKDLVLPRQIAMFLSKKLSRRTLPDIGRRFNGRDHTTVLHAVRKIERMVNADAEFKARVAAIAESIGGTLD